MNRPFSYVALLFWMTAFALNLPAQVRLSEIAPTNTGQIIDEDDDQPDWIEIRNGGTQTTNFLGWGLSDGSKSSRWLLPNVDLEPGERLLVFASGKNRGSTTPPVGSIDHWETAIYEGDTWHYQIGQSDPASDWNTSGFDDSAWATGPGGIGYGDGDDGTTVPNGTLSIYYRKTFTVTDINAIASAVLSMDYDDGFIAYLNGQEIARSATVVGQPSWNTLVSDHEATFYNNVAPPEAFNVNQTTLNNLLQPGQNVLAIELHNALTNSSDLSGRSWLHFGIASGASFFGTNPAWFNPGGTFTGNLHTDFKINFADRISLYNELGDLVDSVTLKPLQAGHSLMRINDEGNWCITTAPTPGASNGFDCENNYSGLPGFSLAAGFYAGAQSVALLGSGEIRYTLDGSEPDLNSTLYAAPIDITQNTVIRARRYEAFKLPSAVATASYFIDENVSLPVVSISLPPDDFSEVYDNYSRKGVLGVEYFDKNKQVQFDGNFAGYVVGNWSVSFPQKSIQFDADEDYGSLGEIDYPIFADKPIQHYHSFRIRNEDDDFDKARMRDRIVNELAAPTNAGRAAYQNVIAFINGQYWGHYVARERLDNYFVRDNYGANPDSVNMVKTYFNLNIGGTQDIAENGNLEDFESMTNFISNQDMTNAANYQQAAQLLDLENFTDYMLTEIFVASTDWLQDYYNNIRLFKNDKNSPWKFLLWDVSYSSGHASGCASCDVLGSTLSGNHRYNLMLKNLLDNPEYKRYFINRFADLMNTSFLPVRAHALIDVNATELSPEINRHNQRWGTGSLSQWSGHVQDLKDFYTQRPDNQRQHIVDNFQLDQEVNITLAANPTGAGVIKISTVVPESLPWSGVYFHGNPVTVTAIPNPGYSFVNWSANAYISDLLAPSFTVDVPGSTIFRANFSGQSQDLALKITEINYNSEPTRDAGDWFEISNQGSVAVDISDFTVRDNDWFHRFTIPTGTIMEAGSHLVFYENSAEFFAENPSVQATLGPISFHLDNDGDELHLFDRNGALVGTAAYQDALPWPCTADGFGSTLERKETNNDPNASDSWFAGCVGGSPGTVFVACAETPTITEINYKSALNADAGDWVELYNRSNSPLDLSGWFIEDGIGNRFEIPSGTSIPPGAFHVFVADDVKFSALFPAVSNITGNLGFGLNGNGDMVRLFTPDGRLYLSMCFNDAAPWPNGPDGNGYTLENAQIDGNINDAANWFAGCLGGSPGQAFDINCGNVGTQESPAQALDFQVWPNPVKELLYFQLSSQEPATIRVLDVHGKAVLSLESVIGGGHLPLNGLTPGIYLVEARLQHGEMARQKIMVVK